MKTQARNRTLVCILSREEGAALEVAKADAGCTPDQAALWHRLRAQARETAERRGLRTIEIWAGSRHGGHLVTEEEM